MKLSPVPRPPPPSEIFKHVRVWRAPVYWAAARGAIERERERERERCVEQPAAFSSRAP